MFRDLKVELDSQTVHTHLFDLHHPLSRGTLSELEEQKLTKGSLSKDGG